MPPERGSGIPASTMVNSISGTTVTMGDIYGATAGSVMLSGVPPRLSTKRGGRLTERR